MKRICFSDCETFSPNDIRAGVFRYAEDVEVIVFAYAFDDGPVNVWDCTAGPMPDDLAEAFDDPECTFIFHNAQFDVTVINASGIASLTVDRVLCTMAQAMAHGLPGSLGQLGDVLGIDEDKAKLKDGKALIKLFCMPLKTTAKKTLVRATRTTHPADWRRFLEYAANDITALREIYKKLPKWNYREGGTEVALWRLDQTINARGVGVDLALAHAATESAMRLKDLLNEETRDRTFGLVNTATQRDAMLLHVIQAYGVTLPDMKTSTVESFLNDTKADIPLDLRELLEVRISSSRSSATKYKALIKATSSDSRLRGSLQFCGASRTGRFAGRIFQPQNLMRVPKYLQKQYDYAIDTIKAGVVDLVFDNPMEVLGAAVRGALVAPPGKKFVIADLSNIEGRVLAWLAGEEWKLEAFREFDAGRGADLYKLAYAKSFGVPVESVDSGDQRQIGKIQELALGFGGSVGAFLTFAAAYGIDLDAMATAVLPTLSARVRAQSTRSYEWAVKNDRTYELSRDAYIVCDALKSMWREAHAEIVAWWREVGIAARMAILNPGQKFPARHVTFIRTGSWLRAILPSGRCVCYPAPRLDGEKISYMGVDQFTKQWGRIDTYEGKIVENCIAIGTPVLTKRGWVAIQNVAPSDSVWDGVEWVRTRGAINNGRQQTIKAFGVWMTPDHRVLTTEGWRNASQSSGYYRAEGRVPNGYQISRIQRAELALGSGLPLRSGEANGSIRIKKAAEKGRQRFMRLHAPADYRRKEYAAWNVAAPSVLGVAQHGRSVLATYASGMGQLWWTGYHRMRSLAGIVREVLGGYGADVFRTADVGPHGQYPRIFAGELPLGFVPSTGMQHTAQPVHRNAVRANAGLRGIRAIGLESNNPTVSSRSRLAGSRYVQAPRLHQQVFDILNAGPRNRFVVASEDGQPLIVHNCTQAAARDVMAANMPHIERAGYQIVLSIHDELVCEAPDEPQYNHEHLSQLLAANPDWAGGLPLAAAGFETTRYRKE